MSTKRKFRIISLPSQIIHQIFVKIDVKSHINLLRCCKFSRNFIDANIKRSDRIHLDQLLRIDVRFDQITIRRYDDIAHFLWSGDLDFNGELPDFGFNLMRFFSVELKGEIDSRAIETLTRILRPLNISCEILDHPRLEYHLLEKFCTAVEALEVEIRIDQGDTIPNGNWHLKVGAQKLTIFTENAVDFNIMDFARSHNNLVLLTYGNDVSRLMNKAVEEFFEDIRSESFGISNSVYISNVQIFLWQHLMTSNKIKINEMVSSYSTAKSELQLIPHKTEKYFIAVISTRWHNSDEANLQFEILRSMEDLIHFLCSYYEHLPFDFSEYLFSNGNRLSSFEPQFQFL